jgi:hypothetical protein
MLLGGLHPGALRLGRGLGNGILLEHQNRLGHLAQFVGPMHAGDVDIGFPTRQATHGVLQAVERAGNADLGNDEACKQAADDAAFAGFGGALRPPIDPRIVVRAHLLGQIGKKPVGPGEIGCCRGRVVAQPRFDCWRDEGVDVLHPLLQDCHLLGRRRVQLLRLLQVLHRRRVRGFGGSRCIARGLAGAVVSQRAIACIDHLDDLPVRADEVDGCGVLAEHDGAVGRLRSGHAAYALHGDDGRYHADEGEKTENLGSNAESLK